MTILVMGPRWLATDHGGSQYRALGHYPALQRASNLVWHPEQVSVGMASFEGDPRHAVTLLERRLRSQGEISSDVKILILQLQRTGRSYQVLYVTVALDEWQQMLSWAAAQAHICRVSLMAVLAYKFVQPGRAVVLQADRHFHFFARHEGQLVHLQAVAVDHTLADLEGVAAMLGLQAREEMAAKGCTDFNVLWLPVAFEGPRSELDVVTAAFSQAAQGVAVKVECEALRASDGSAAVLHTGLRSMVRQAQSKDLVNEGNDLWHVLAREYLPFGALAALALSTVLAYLAYGWMVQADVLRQQAQRLQAQEADVRQNIAVIRRDTRLDAPGVKRQVEVLTLLKKIQGDHDPVRLLDALRQGAQGGIRILSVGTQRSGTGAGEATTRASEPAIVVDGTLPENLINSDRDTRSLSTLVKTLNDHGYRAEPVDIRTGVSGQDSSTRLFAYRLTRIEARQEGGP